MMSLSRAIIVSATMLLLGACSGEEGMPGDGSGGSSTTGSGGSAAGTGGASSGGAAASSSGGALGSGGALTGSGGMIGGGGSPASGGSGSGGESETGSGGADGSGGSTDGAIPMGNPAVKSPGCGKATTVTSKEYKINSSGQERTYYVEMPANYDMNKPYRLFYTSHWIGSRYQDVKNQDYYFLKPLIEADGEQAIFVAPSSDGSTWQEKDHALFDDILALMKESVCFDTTRVFATGFSFGGMITYSLSTNHQTDIRAAVGIAPANYNIWLPEKTRKPIAWMHMTGMSDGTCPWVNNEGQKRGAKFIALEKAEDNGCTIPNDVPVWQNGGHFCYDFEDCDPEHPTRVCTFGGGHTNIDNEQGVNWIPKESWDFFKQF